MGDFNFDAYQVRGGNGGRGRGDFLSFLSKIYGNKKTKMNQQKPTKTNKNQQKPIKTKQNKQKDYGYEDGREDGEDKKIENEIHFEEAIPDYDDVWELLPHDPEDKGFVFLLLLLCCYWLIISYLFFNYSL